MTLLKTFQTEAIEKLPATLLAIKAGTLNRAPMLLLDGNAGGGKTFLATAITTDLGAEMVSIPESLAEFETLLEKHCALETSGIRTWFCDESHGMADNLKRLLLKLADTDGNPEISGENEKAPWHWFRSRNVVILATNYGFNDPALLRRSIRVTCNPLAKPVLQRIAVGVHDSLARQLGVSLPPTASVWRTVMLYCGDSPGSITQLLPEALSVLATSRMHKGAYPVTGMEVKAVFRDTLNYARHGVFRDTLRAVRFLAEHGPMQRQAFLTLFKQGKRSLALTFDDMRQRGWVGTLKGLQALTPEGRAWLSAYDAETLTLEGGAI